ncbi:MAG: hypothetical protein O3B41_11410 [Bacteroidetes bacterium]|nr:hypothetical protein [Bacteroidota bacterium]
MRIDEHLLAGYLAGELNDQDRSSVTIALLRDRGLREWLTMASEALAASKMSGGLMNRMAASMNPSRPGIRREDRRAMPSTTAARRVG